MNRRSFLVRASALIGAAIIPVQRVADRTFMAWYRAAIAANEVPNGIVHGIDNWGRPLR